MIVSPEHFKRINKAVNFINDNPSENLSLENLAKLANYSPFHFQKLFKLTTGETPKQYILRVRLETAAHSVIMFQHKSITEIALDFGFSSSATFARAFKNYFGISAQELRNTSEEERLKLFRSGNQLLEVDNYFLNVQSDVNEFENISNVVVKRTESIRGIFVNAALDNEAEIDLAFKKIAQLADVNELITGQTKFIGILYPHQKLYQAFATVEDHQGIAKNLNIKEIMSGKFAVIRIKGTIKQPFNTMRNFTKVWLPNSGYQISNIFGFEVLAANPSCNSYHEIERDLHIPIEAIQ